MDHAIVRRENIVDGIFTLGVVRGMVLEFHGALSSLGWVEGGAEAVIDALIETVGLEGTLLMSAYPVTSALPLTDEEIARGITWKVRILEDPNERTGLGLIVDTFRKRPDIHLGNGLHRICAWGRDAARHAEIGYKYLVGIDGWTLLVGVGVDRVSSLHLAEEDPGLPEDIRHLFEPPSDLLRDYPPNYWDIGYGSTPEDAWSKVWEEADKRCLIRKGTIGQANCALFKTRDLLTVYQDWLRIDPYGLFGLKKKNSNNNSISLS